MILEDKSECALIKFKSKLSRKIYSEHSKINLLQFISKQYLLCTVIANQQPQNAIYILGVMFVR